jgi:hypothetical protein
LMVRGLYKGGLFGVAGRAAGLQRAASGVSVVSGEWLLVVALIWRGAMAGK